MFARRKRDINNPPRPHAGHKYTKNKWRESECEGPGVPSQIEPLLGARHCQQQKGALAQNKHTHKMRPNKTHLYGVRTVKRTTLPNIQAMVNNVVF
jgi:hypothetical protein